MGDGYNLPASEGNRSRLIESLFPEATRAERQEEDGRIKALEKAFEATEQERQAAEKKAEDDRLARLMAYGLKP